MTDMLPNGILRAMSRSEKLCVHQQMACQRFRIRNHWWVPSTLQQFWEHKHSDRKECINRINVHPQFSRRQGCLVFGRVVWATEKPATMLESLFPLQLFLHVVV